MYLADIRAVDYLASRPDWDGKTLVVMGTSMGGQQSLCTAGLHPKVTAMLVNVPAGADANGTAHGRKIGYPNWDVNDPKVLETAQYFDTVNCAARIKVPSLVAMGFIDTVTPPVGIWAAFNQIKAPEASRADDRVASQPPGDARTIDAVDPKPPARWLARAGRRPLAHRDAPTWPMPRSDENSQHGPRTTAGQAQGRADRRVLRGRFDHAPLGHERRAVQGLARQLERQLQGLERRAISAGAATRPSTCCGACRTASSTACNPKVVVVMAGTNNVGNATPLGDAAERAADVARGVTAIVREIRKRAPRRHA